MMMAMCVPFGATLQTVDRIGHEKLLVQRIGIAGVAILRALALREAHSRQPAFASAVQKSSKSYCWLAPSPETPSTVGRPIRPASLGGK